jgi:alkylation response protein AidB-like acyl-CoA dehydrogenase
MAYDPPPGTIVDEVKRRFGAFVLSRVNPDAHRRDELGEPISRELLRDAAALGAFGYVMPRDVGGEGRDTFSWGVVLETLGQLSADGSFPLLVSLLPSIGMALYELEREDLRERYVRPLVRGERFGAWSYTEGADPFSFRSRARPRDDGYVLNGQKWLITGGAIADFFIVYLGSDSGDLKVFLVERDDPGVEIIPEPALGVRASGLASLRMTDVVVGKERVLLAGDGISHAQAYLNKRRALIACPVVGAMRSLLGVVIDQLSTTERYGMPLTAFTNVVSTVGEMSALLETSRTLLYFSLDRLRWEGSNPQWDPQVSLAKYAISRNATVFASRAMHIVGTQGYLRGVFERFLRDANSLIVGAGTQDSLQISLGSHLQATATRPERSS